ncbi:MAG: prephenate dehydrogenase/arogenate dehydrogenase family protein [Polyangiaceae bacterium]|nr:prephenate dehydrogenase/arogenate dehydrogenase family protein [Polyangiaceae bacterium]
MTSVTIVGLGLIGGSIALSLRAHGIRLVGADRPEVLSSELGARVVDERVDATDPEALAAATRDSDLVVMSAPVGTNLRLLPSVLEHARVVTDTGSTKRAMASAAARMSRGARFVGGHPMAGRAQSGLGAATPDLFVGRPWILCTSGAEEAATLRVEELVQMVGAVAVHMTPEHHDRAVALTSHAPQVLASLLAVLTDERRAAQTGGPTFEQMTRTAGGEVSMWRDVFATNGDEVANALRALGHELLGLADALAQSPPDVAQVLALLERARTTKSRH